MFAETSRQRDNGVNHRLARHVASCLQENAYDSVVNRLQRESRVQLDQGYRQDLLQQIRLQYKKRSYPQETYEDWIRGMPQKRTDAKQLGDKVIGHQEIRSAPNSEEFRDFNDKVFHEHLMGLRPGRENELIEEEEIAELKALSRKARGIVVPAHELSKEASAQDGTEAETEDLTDSEISATDDALLARRSLKQWKTEDSDSRNIARGLFIIQKAGLDPIAPSEPQSVKHQHCKSIRTLLHLTIMNRKWDLAYKLYSLLIKIQGINYRLIWPLGAEILQGRLEQIGKKGSAASLTNARQMRVQQKMLQDFLSWLSTSYSLASWSVTGNTKYGQPFIGYSKTHAPAYVITLLWSLLADKVYSKVRDTLDELLLKPPFSTHGLFHYMLALCCVCENIDLRNIAERFDDITSIMDQDPVTSDYGDLVQEMAVIESLDSISARIQANVSQARALLQECDALDFQYPKDSFMGMLGDFDSDVKADSYISVKSKEGNGTGIAHFGLKCGKLILTSNHNYTIPKHLIKKFLPEKESNVWLIAFFNISHAHICKVCLGNIKAHHVDDLKSHLSQHGIDSDNYAAHDLFLDTLKSVERADETSILDSDSEESLVTDDEFETTEEFESDESSIHSSVENESISDSNKIAQVPEISEPPAPHDSESQDSRILGVTKPAVEGTMENHQSGASSTLIESDSDQGEVTESNNLSTIIPESLPNSPENETAEHTQESPDVTIYHDAIDSDEESGESFVIKLEDDESDESSTSFAKSNGSHQKTGSFLDDSNQGISLESSGRGKRPESSFMAHTQVFNSLLHEASGDVTAQADDIDYQSTQYTQDGPLDADSQSFVENAPIGSSFGSPKRTFQNFSPDSSFDNHEHERDVSHAFHQLATQTSSHVYFPESRSEIAVPNGDILTAKTDNVPDVPNIEPEHIDNFGKSEANTKHTWEKDTWSDEFDESSDDEEVWWNNYGFHKERPGSQTDNPKHLSEEEDLDG